MSKDLKTIENKDLAVQPAQLIQTAIEKDLDVDKLERLVAMQERWEEKQARRRFYEALARFQTDVPPIYKTKQGHNYVYTPLSDIVEIIKPYLLENGLTYRFEQDHSNGISVTCVVTHADGHSERTSMAAKEDATGSKNAVQAIASTVTYLSRYTLTGALGLVTADSDMDGRLPGDTVDADQAAALKKGLQDTGSDVKKFCATFGCETVDTLPSVSFTRAMAMIDSKRAK